MKCFAKWFISITVMVIILAISLAKWRSNLWERALIGPFMGESHFDKVEGTPNSSLEMPTGDVLQLFRDAKSGHPVLCLRTPHGSNAWCQILVPERVIDGTTNTGKIHEIYFRRYYRAPNGYKIRVSCNWDWGGEYEGGMIYLKQDLSFNGFALSW